MRQDIAKGIGIALFVVGVMSLGVWRCTARMADCEQLGHGPLYCLFVWGSR